MKRSIFEIEDELVQIAEAFDQLEETGTEDGVLTALEAYFGSLLEERDEKLDRYAGFITNILAMASIRKAEADRLAKLAKIDENRAKRLKDHLFALFQQNGWTKMDTAFHKFSICKNGSATPLVVDETVAMEKIDPTYKKVVVSLDNEAIRADLEAGIHVPFATLGDRGSHIRIK